MKYDRRNLKWNGWGWTDQQFPLDEPDALWSFLRDELDLDALPDTPAVPLDAIHVPSSRLSPTQRKDVTELFDTGHVRTSAYERLYHAAGRSYFDLVRLRTAQIDHFPDAVLYPSTQAEVERAVQFADTHDLALIPFGGGSSVVGGVEADRSADQAGVLTLDTMHLNRIRRLNPATRTATVEAGLYGPELERRLQAAGFTLGHFPQSFHFSTLGGWIAARSAGQFSDRYGKAEDFLAHATVVSPTGTWSTSSAPASAAGPDLNAIVAGSEGAMGVITQATVHIHPTPPVEKTYMILFRHVAEGVHAVRQLRQDEQLPLSMLRLSDAEETRFLMRLRSGTSSLGARLYKAVLGLRGYTDRPALLLVGLTGAPGAVRRGTRRMLRLCRQAGGAFVGPRSDWRSGHYAMPYLRDDLMDRGIGVDTMETATTWGQVLHLHQAVRRAAARHAADAGYTCATLGHISHSYPDGASLYFTFLFPMDRGREQAQWRALKHTVSGTIVSHGGTISHHHGVGRDHRPWLERERGRPALDVVRAIKRQLDPHGTCNPGSLVG